MNPLLLKNRPFLTEIVKTRSNKERQELISNASTEQILMIVEICLNILKMRFPLNRQQLTKLGKHEEYIRKLARVRSEKTARNLLLQKGSGPPLAALLIPVLSSLASELIDKIRNK